MKFASRTLLYLLLLSFMACGKKSHRHESEPASQAVSDLAEPTPQTPMTVLSRLGDPFEGVRFFANPDFSRNVETSIAKALPSEEELLRKAATYPTAIWITSINQAASVGHWLDLAHEQQVQTSQLTLTVLVVYDLPNRDCAAPVSTGEFHVEANGETRYRNEFIDSIASQIQTHSDQPVVLILEPDSLPNLVSNLNIPKCAASGVVYKRSIAYAISKLAMPNVSIYLDAAHAGWLGWLDLRSQFANIVKGVLDAAGGASKIRGFVTNVANYSSLRGASSRALTPDNPCPNELSYVAELASSLRFVGIDKVKFVIDTSRNGVDQAKTSSRNWCNLARAGLGERPQAAPLPNIDAYYWIKIPGESDGTSDRSQPGFDENCGSPDSAKGSLPAGSWFTEHFLSLVRHANPPL